MYGKCTAAAAVHFEFEYAVTRTSEALLTASVPSLGPHEKRHRREADLNIALQVLTNYDGHGGQRVSPRRMSRLHLAQPAQVALIDGSHARLAVAVFKVDGE